MKAHINTHLCCANKLFGFLKLKNSLLLGTLIIFITACSNISGLNAENYCFKKLPPNGCPIAENLYYVGTEVTNLGWLEYKYWTKKNFGKNSSEFEATIPDTASWSETDSCLNEYTFYYLRHPATRYNPVVGITHQQASDFAKWRTDRVLEHILTITGEIEFDTAQNSKTYFTAKKYYSGNYNGIVPNLKIPYPSYRLPTKKDRITALLFTDSVRLTKPKVKEPTELYSPVYGSVVCFYDDKPDSCKFPLEPTKSVYFKYAKKTNELIYHLRGNVCEWSAEPNICFGGSFKTSMDSIIVKDSYKVSDTANIFTGFRNVCEWKYWE